MQLQSITEALHTTLFESRTESLEIDEADRQIPLESSEMQVECSSEGFQMDRNGRGYELGRGAGGWCSHVGDEIEQSPVGFMADCANHRDWGGKNRSHQVLVVKGGQIGCRSTAACDNYDVWHFGENKGLECSNQIGRCSVTLHGCRRQQQSGEWISAAHDILDVVPNRAGRRGHDSNDSRIGGNGPLTRFRKESLSFELLAKKLKLKRGQADACLFNKIDIKLIRSLGGIDLDLSMRH